MTTENATKVEISSSTLVQLKKDGILLPKGGTLAVRSAATDPGTAFKFAAPADAFKTIPLKNDETFSMTNFGTVDDSDNRNPYQEFSLLEGAPEVSQLIVREKTTMLFGVPDVVHEIPVFIGRSAARRHILRQMEKDLAEARSAVEAAQKVKDSQYQCNELVDLLRLPAECEVVDNQPAIRTEDIMLAVKQQIQIFRADEQYAKAAADVYELYLTYLKRLDNLPI